MNTHLARRWPLLSMLALASVATGGWQGKPITGLHPEDFEGRFVGHDDLH